MRSRVIATATPARGTRRKCAAPTRAKPGAIRSSSATRPRRSRRWPRRDIRRHLDHLLVPSVEFGNNPAYWPRGAGALDGALDAALYGFGVTGEPVRSVGLYPHGPVLDDSRLLYPDSGTFDGALGRRPEPIVPGQHIWYYPQQETEAGETVCGIIRCPGAVV